MTDTFKHTFQDPNTNGVRLRAHEFNEATPDNLHTDLQKGFWAVVVTFMCHHLTSTDPLLTDFYDLNARLPAAKVWANALAAGQDTFDALARWWDAWYSRNQPQTPEDADFLAGGGNALSPLPTTSPAPDPASPSPTRSKSAARRMVSSKTR